MSAAAAAVRVTGTASETMSMCDFDRTLGHTMSDDERESFEAGDSVTLDSGLRVEAVAPKPPISLRDERINKFEDLLRRAVTTIEPTRGRSHIDDRGIGAVKMLLVKSLESIAVIRHDLANFPKVCSCGEQFAQSQWAELELLGEQDDGAGGALEMRVCHCRSTMAIQAR